MDLSFEEGGANWDSRRSKAIATRISEIIKQSDVAIKSDSETSAKEIGGYLEKYFKLEFDEAEEGLLYSILKLRIENLIDRKEFREKLNMSEEKGGLGLYKNTSERIAREVEIIMLLKYSSL